MEPGYFCECSDPDITMNVNGGSDKIFINQSAALESSFPDESVIWNTFAVNPGLFVVVLFCDPNMRNTGVFPDEFGCRDRQSFDSSFVNTINKLKTTYYFMLSCYSHRQWWA
jgi:hypothetical protein